MINFFVWLLALLISILVLSITHLKLSEPCQKTLFLEKIRNIMEFIICVYGFILILFIKFFPQILALCYAIFTCLRVLYYIDLEDWTSDGSILLMDGEGSNTHKFKKPGFSHHQGSNTSGSITGSKRGPEELSSNVNTVYTRDNGIILSSRNPKDWGVNVNHDFGGIYHNYGHHCQQMANLLEYHNKVHGRKLVCTAFDVMNPFLNHSASEFFDSFVESRNIPCAPMSDKIANTEELRNTFRSQGFKKTENE